MAESTIHTFDDITERLDQIIAQVRSKDTSLERSLDLFDEAIALGSKAVDLADSFDSSAPEEEALEQGAAAAEATVDGDASQASATPEESQA